MEHSIEEMAEILKSTLPKEEWAVYAHEIDLLAHDAAELEQWFHRSVEQLMKEKILKRFKDRVGTNTTL